MKLHKKGNFQEMSNIGVGVAILSLMLVISLLIMANTKTQAITQIVPTSYAGTSVALANATAVSFAACIPDETMSVSQVYNGTAANSIVLVAGNYSVTSNTVTITDYTEAGSTDTTKSINYTCRDADYAYNSTSTLQNATGTIPGWVPLIVLIFIGGILLIIVRRISVQ